MRTLTLSILAAALILAGGGRAGAQAEARAIVEKAIKAHGGEANLNKYPGTQAKQKGLIHLPNLEVSFVQEMTFQWPGKMRDSVSGEAAGAKFKTVTVFNGDNGWLVRDGKTEEMNSAHRTALKESMYQIRLRKLTLLRDAQFQLSTLGEIQINDRPSLGLRVSAKGHQDVSLFFDKESGLLVKMESKFLNPATNKEVEEERYLGEYQTVNGVKTPKKLVVYRDGKKFIEGEVTDFKFLSKVDEHEFDKP